MKTGYRIFTLTLAICLLSRAMAPDTSMTLWPWFVFIGGVSVGLFTSSLEGER